MKFNTDVYTKQNVFSNLLYFASLLAHLSSILNNFIWSLFLEEKLQNLTVSFFFFFFFWGGGGGV